MTELITKNCWWPKVIKDVGKYIDIYNLYQRIKNRIEVLVGKLKLSKVPEKLWMHLTVNFITKLPLVAGKDVILVVCDRLFKITHVMATTEGISAEGLVRLFRNNIWKLYILLESMVLDRGPHFTAELTKELNKMLRFETKLFMLFHLQTDRQKE